MKPDETTLNNNNKKRLIEDKDTSPKELSNKLEGYHTCTRCLLERINPNIAESQISDVDSNVDSYEINIGKLPRRTDLFESNSNPYFNK